MSSFNVWLSFYLRETAAQVLTENMTLMCHFIRIKLLIFHVIMDFYILLIIPSKPIAIL